MPMGVLVIKFDNCASFSIVDCITCVFIIKHSIHNMLTMDTIILRDVLYILGMFMEERKIAL